MKKYALTLIFIAAAAYGSPCENPHCNTSGAEQPSIGSRQRVVYEANKLIGTREATGKNDGVVVEEMLRSVGLEKGYPWCGAFPYYVYSRAGLGHLVPRSGWSPDWVAGAQWKQGRGATPRPGDTFGIWFSSRGRVAHTGIVEEWGEDSVTTIEGNTNGAGSREGDGVYRKWRMQSQIYAVRDWITPR